MKSPVLTALNEYAINLVRSINTKIMNNQLFFIPTNMFILIHALYNIKIIFSNYICSENGHIVFSFYINFLSRSAIWLCLKIYILCIKNSCYFNNFEILKFRTFKRSPFFVFVKNLKYRTVVFLFIII